VKIQNSTVLVRLPLLHSAQEQIRSGAGRFNVLNCGRRFGKDVLGQDLLVEPALAEKGLPTAWFAPTYRMMLDTFREVADTLRPVASKINASDHRIELVTGGVIDMWSLDVPDVARGRKYKRVIINEAALVPDLTRVFQKVIRPTLADYQGDAWFLSTPVGHNDFFDLYNRQFTNENWRGWTYPTSANPYIPASEIEEMRRDMPDTAFRQEILAEFVAVEGALFQRNQFNIVDSAPADLKWLRTYDLALTTNEASDRTASLCGARGVDACPCHGIVDPLYIRDGFAMKAEYPEVKAAMIGQALVDGRGVRILVETVAFQLAAFQELQRVPELVGYSIVGEKPKGGKIERLRPAQDRAVQGQIHLVRGAWINDFLDEITSITVEMEQEHDDYGDALSALVKNVPEPVRVQRLRQPEPERGYQDAAGRAAYGR
jgi:predicted phage terminase large subunit-like protein